MKGGRERGGECVCLCVCVYANKRGKSKEKGGYKFFNFLKIDKLPARGRKVSEGDVRNEGREWHPLLIESK